MKKYIIIVICLLFSRLTAQDNICLSPKDTVTSELTSAYKVMTYNIRLDVASDGENAWSNRKDFFTSQVQFYAPDVMGIQEALPNQVQDIAQSLPNYQYVGIGRDEEGKGEASNIFYRTDKLKMIENHTFWLSEAPTQPSMGWDAACRRVCTYALFEDMITHQQFWVFNTHLDHVGEVAREKSAQLIRAKMKEVNTKKLPVIFTGDFNATPDTAWLSDLKKEMNDSKDISEEKPFGPNETFNGFQYNEIPETRIDYIFTSKGIKVKKYAVLAETQNLRFPSDHFPVYTEIQLK